jgi:hypothetical protein
VGQEQELKWRIQDELRKVPMKAPVKALVWDLLSRARVADAVIPETHTPSLTELEGSACLGRSTVTTYLRALEATGWVVRERPSIADSLGHGQRTQYRLAVGSFDLPPVIKHEKHTRKPRKDSVISAGSGADLGQELNQGRSGDDPTRDVETGHDSSGADLPRKGDRSGDDLGLGQEMTSTRSGDDLNKELPTGVLSSSVHQDSSSAADAADEEKPKTESKKRAKKREPQRDDVDQLCTRLADHIEKNTGERPRISEDWKKSARLLLDTDKRELDKALSLIDWCQNDGFWHTNILSMPTFRKQYLQLRTKAVAEWEKSKRIATPQGPESTAPKRLAESEKCPEHRRPLPCGLCRAEQMGSRDAA